MPTVELVINCAPRWSSELACHWEIISGVQNTGEQRMIHRGDFTLGQVPRVTLRGGRCRGQV